MTIGNEWQDALAYIQGKVPKQVYHTWFTPIHLERIEDSTAQLGVPNKFFCDWLSQHHGALLIFVHYPSAKDPSAKACTTARRRESSPSQRPPVTGKLDGVLQSRKKVSGRASWLMKSRPHDSNVSGLMHR